MFKAKDYVRAESLEEAYALNQKKSSVVIGGMHWLKLGKRIWMTVIDLSDLGLNQIREADDCFTIDCMCTLRQLETHEGLNAYFDHVFRECTRHIVGVQFRNGATVGGSVFGRFGFSDILTCLLALDTYVELYKGGIIPLKEFCERKRDRDILVRIIVKKDGRKVAYSSQRQSETDFPLIACAASRRLDTWYLSVGARPSAAVLTVVKNTGSLEEMAASAVKQMEFRTNMRGSAEYRRELAAIYLKRLMAKIGEEDR